MTMFGTLYRFELKKLLQKPYVPVLLVLMIAVTVFLNVRPLLEEEDVIYAEEDGTLTFDTVSRYEAIQLERRFSREDAGTLLDNEAASAARAMNHYYQQLEDPDQPPTFIMLNHFLVTDSQMEMGINPIFEGQEHLADFAYETMGAWQEEEYQNQSLTQEETRYWEQERAGLETPFTLAYAKGYSGILSLACWLNLMVLIFVFISLCGSFSDDHAYRTWPMLVSARHGRRPLVLARLAAGVSLAWGSLLLLFAITAAIQLLVHGTDGVHSPIQLLSLTNLRPGHGDTHLCASSRVMEAGQAVLVTLGISLLVILFASALAMLLSKLLRRAVPALALPLGILLFSLLFEPSFYAYDRLHAQIWSYLPIQRLYETLLLDERLVSLGPVQLDCLAMSVLLYGGLALLFLICCVVLHKMHAVSRM